MLSVESVSFVTSFGPLECPRPVPLDISSRDRGLYSSGTFCTASNCVYSSRVSEGIESCTLPVLLRGTRSRAHTPLAPRTTGVCPSVPLCPSRERSVPSGRLDGMTSPFAFESGSLRARFERYGQKDTRTDARFRACLGFCRAPHCAYPPISVRCPIANGPRPVTTATVFVCGLFASSRVPCCPFPVFPVAGRSQNADSRMRRNTRRCGFGTCRNAAEHASVLAESGAPTY